MENSPRTRLSELARLFLILGSIGVGGPAAHIALMRREVVERRGWMPDEDFVDLVGATSLIPGPNSTELAIWIGQRRGGWRGLLVAGCSFILPAALLVMLIGELYLRYGTTPAFESLRYGVLPVIVAIVVHAVWGLGRTTLRTIALFAIALGAAALRIAGVDELLILLIGLGVAAIRALVTTGRGPRTLNASAIAFVLAATHVTLGRLFLVFLKFGSVVFGSGYVLLAFLEHDLVDDLGWLTRDELLDAIAVGQITPGPVFTTATFIGYVLRGVPGAVLATVAIFLPSFVLVALLSRALPAALRSRWARPLLDGVNATAVGLMAAVALELSGDAVIDLPTALVAAVALAALVATRINAAWLVVIGAAVGGLHALVT